jgi:hypothetical protein
MTVRGVFVRFREVHNLQWCESPAETKMLDRLDAERDRIPGAPRLAAVCLGMMR